MKKMKFVGNLIFFLNVVVGLLIIAGALVLAESEFGRSAMIFGFLMLCISIVLKTIKEW